MKIERIPMRNFGANCYLLEEDGIAAVIDPGEVNDDLLSRIKGLELRYILLTHGHFDHILGVAELKKETGAKVCIHPDDAPMLQDENLSLSARNVPGLQVPVTADVFLYDGEILDFPMPIEVLHTPGHTKGSVCFKIDHILFTGDTLFCRTVGRTDFPGGSMEELIRSVDRLQALPGDYTLYPGHNRATTMEAERKHNRYIRKKNAYLNSQS